MTDLPPPAGRPWAPPPAGPGTPPDGTVSPPPAAAAPPPAPPAPAPPWPTLPSPTPGDAGADATVGAPPTVRHEPILPGAPEQPRGSRLPAIIGAVLAIAIGAGAVLWFTRSDDDEAGPSGSGGSDTVATSDAADSDSTDASADDTAITVATETTVADTVAPSSAPATPTTVETATTPAVTTSPLPVLDAPPGAVPYADPAGWQLALDPAWTPSPGAAAWVTGTGSPEFQDNVNVAVEALPGPSTLDGYVQAAVSQIATQAPDFQIVSQRRVVGSDGVEVELLGWSGSFAGLPKLAFVQAVTLTSTSAYIATFTSQPDRMPALAPAIEPFLASIRGT